MGTHRKWHSRLHWRNTRCTLQLGFAREIFSSVAGTLVVVDATGAPDGTVLSDTCPRAHILTHLEGLYGPCRMLRAGDFLWLLTDRRITSYSKLLPSRRLTEASIRRNAITTMARGSEQARVGESSRGRGRKADWTASSAKGKTK